MIPLQWATSIKTLQIHDRQSSKRGIVNIMVSDIIIMIIAIITIIIIIIHIIGIIIIIILVIVIIMVIVLIMKGALRLHPPSASGLGFRR